MRQFTIKLAGLGIRVAARYDATLAFCREYLTEEPARLFLEISPEDLEYERERSLRETTAEGRKGRPFSMEYLETLAVYRKIAEKLPFYDTFLFHGSALSLDGEGYLFAAPSGTGKSTHAGLWRQEFGSRVVMVNDDKPLLKITGSEVTVYGTPWDGKHHLSSNMAVRLKGLCLLERSDTNRIRPVSPREAWPGLMGQTYRPADPEALERTLKLVDGLSKRVELWRLGCTVSAEAARIAADGMRGRRQDEAEGRIYHP